LETPDTYYRISIDDIQRPCPNCQGKCVLPPGYSKGSLAELIHTTTGSPTSSLPEVPRPISELIATFLPCHHCGGITPGWTKLGDAVNNRESIRVRQNWMPGLLGENLELHPMLEFKIGQKVEAERDGRTWYPAVIISDKDENGEYRVHYTDHPKVAKRRHPDRIRARESL